MEYKLPSDIDRYKLPKGKEKEFAEKIIFAAWESEMRGYDWFNAKYVLETILKLNK